MVSPQPFAVAFGAAVVGVGCSAHFDEAKTASHNVFYFEVMDTPSSTTLISGCNEFAPAAGALSVAAGSALTVHLRMELIGKQRYGSLPTNPGFFCSTLYDSARSRVPTFMDCLHPSAAADLVSVRATQCSNCATNEADDVFIDIIAKQSGVLEIVDCGGADRPTYSIANLTVTP